MKVIDQLVDHLIANGLLAPARLVHLRNSGWLLDSYGEDRVSVWPVDEDGVGPWIPLNDPEALPAGSGSPTPSRGGQRASETREREAQRRRLLLILDGRRDALQTLVHLVARSSANKVQLISVIKAANLVIRSVSVDRFQMIHDGLIRQSPSIAQLLEFLELDFAGELEKAGESIGARVLRARPEDARLHRLFSSAEGRQLLNAEFARRALLDALREHRAPSPLPTSPRLPDADRGRVRRMLRSSESVAQHMALLGHDPAAVGALYLETPTRIGPSQSVTDELLESFIALMNAKKARWVKTTESLDLSRTLLRVPRALARLPVLRGLDLRWCDKLESLEVVGALPVLRELAIGPHVPAGLERLTQLESLILEAPPHDPKQPSSWPERPLLPPNLVSLDLRTWPRRLSYPDLEELSALRVLVGRHHVLQGALRDRVTVM